MSATVSMVITAFHHARPAPGRRAACLGIGSCLVLASACAFPPRLGTEPDTGRRAVTWGPAEGQSADRGPSIAAAVADETAPERQLRGAIRAADAAGRDDIELAGALYDLAIVRRQQGALEEAAALYLRALSIRERLQGPTHPDVATVLNNLAALEVARDHNDAARPLLERALTIRQQALGDRDPRTVQSLNNLALLYAAQGDTAAAEPLYLRALTAIENGGAGQQADLDRVRDNYAALLRDAGRNRDAERVESGGAARR